MALEKDSAVEGKVSGVTKFGAFITLPENQVGLVHISEIAHAYVTDINQFVKIGDTVKVKVLGMNKQGKYDLSIKRLLPRTSSPPPRRQLKVENSFEDKITSFLKQSEEKLLDWKKNLQEKQEGPKKRKRTK